MIHFPAVVCTSSPSTLNSLCADRETGRRIFVAPTGGEAENSIMEGLGQVIALSPFIVLWLFFTVASARIAHLKNIPISVGLLLGALLGLLGLVIVVCLPSNRKRAPGGPPPGWYPNPAGTGASRYWNGQAWM